MTGRRAFHVCYVSIGKGCQKLCWLATCTCLFCGCRARGGMRSLTAALPGHMSRDMTKPTKCAQRRFRSAWASAQSEQSLRCALSGLLRTQTFFMRTAKTLIRLGECPGWSESSLGAQSLCWFCHVAAHIVSFSWRIIVLFLIFDNDFWGNMCSLFGGNIFP